MGAFFLVDDQGAFAVLKEKLRFSEPLQGSRVRQAKKIKVSRKRYLYFWWTIRVSSQGEGHRLTARTNPFTGSRP